MSTPPPETATVNPTAAARLRELVETIENYRCRREMIDADIAEVFALAKGEGFDRRVINEVLKRRAVDQAARQEFVALVDLYEDVCARAPAASNGEAA